MIEKLKTKLVPKLLALFFIVFELFGVAEIMSIIFWQFDLSTTDYCYLVLNSLTILFVVV